METSDPGCVWVVHLRQSQVVVVVVVVVVDCVENVCVCYICVCVSRPRLGKVCVHV